MKNAVKLFEGALKTIPDEINAWAEENGATILSAPLVPGGA